MGEPSAREPKFLSLLSACVLAPRTCLSPGFQVWGPPKALCGITFLSSSPSSDFFLFFPPMASALVSLAPISTSSRQSGVCTCVPVCARPSCCFHSLQFCGWCLGPVLRPPSSDTLASWVLPAEPPSSWALPLLFTFVSHLYPFVSLFLGPPSLFSVWVHHIFSICRKRVATVMHTLQGEQVDIEEETQKGRPCQ